MMVERETQTGEAGVSRGIRIYDEGTGERNENIRVRRWAG